MISQPMIGKTNEQIKAEREHMELARRSNMTFGELLEWLSRNDREDKETPWEE